MKKIITFSLLALSLAACSVKSPRDKDFSEIKQMEDSDSALMPGFIERITPKYLAFADKYPKDTLTADFLYKASTNLFFLKKYEESIATIDRFMKEFPENEAIPDALFYKGMIYEEGLNNLAKAKETYEQFLLKYPEHALTDDVKVAIEHLGKSPEELFQKIVEQKDTATATKN